MDKDEERITSYHEQQTEMLAILLYREDCNAEPSKSADAWMQLCREDRDSYRAVARGERALSE